MAKVICPYCCHKFEPSTMVFRLNEMLQENTEEEIREDIFNRNRHIRDEKLIKYYRDMEHQTENDAVANAEKINPYGCIEIDFMTMGNDITNYNYEMLKKNNFVMELDYKGHHLDQRVCPNCHNHLIRRAGLYDMKMIAMYGDTNSGKTVYLNILEAMLQGDPALGNIGYAFEGQMMFAGTAEEKAKHDERFESLLRRRELPKATVSGQVVPPQVFEYTYKTAEDIQHDKTVFLVFRDIPGEDCLADDKLKRYSFYLKNADGLIVMIDSSKLMVSTPYLNAGDAANNRQMESLHNLSLLLSEAYGTGKIEIPTAVVLAKGDLFSEVPPIKNGFSKEYNAIMNVSNANDLHQKYLDRKVIDDLHRNILAILKGVHEERLLGVIERSFNDYNLFCMSALGETPITETDLENGEVIQRVNNLAPYRVAEPLYWLMAKNNLIPYRYLEIYRKGDMRRAVQTLYFEWERRSGRAQQRHQEAIKMNRIKTEGLFGKWNLIERTNSF